MRSARQPLCPRSPSKTAALTFPARRSLRLDVLHMTDYFVLAWHLCVWPTPANVKLALIEGHFLLFLITVSFRSIANCGKDLPRVALFKYVELFNLTRAQHLQLGDMRVHTQRVTWKRSYLNKQVGRQKIVRKWGVKREARRNHCPQPRGRSAGPRRSAALRSLPPWRSMGGERAFTPP